MMFFNYPDLIDDGVELFFALGSIIGMLVLIVGLSLMIAGGDSFKHKALPIVMMGFILVAICGFQTGVKYFRIR